MGGRYFITGVQIGLISSLAELENDKEIKKILEEIQEKQYICSDEELDNILKKKNHKKK